MQSFTGTLGWKNVFQGRNGCGQLGGGSAGEDTGKKRRSTSYPTLFLRGKPHMVAEAESSQSWWEKRKFMTWIRSERRKKGKGCPRYAGEMESYHVSVPHWEPMLVGTKLVLPAIKMLKSFHTGKKRLPRALQVYSNCPGLFLKLLHLPTQQEASRILVRAMANICSDSLVPLLTFIMLDPFIPNHRDNPG